MPKAGAAVGFLGMSQRAYVLKDYVVEVVLSCKDQPHTLRIDETGT